MKNLLQPNPGPLIRLATEKDAKEVKDCITAAFELYVERIGRPPVPMLLDIPAAIEAKQVWVADWDGIIVGVLVQYVTEDGFYIDTVAVHPTYQRTGIGKALLQFAEREAVRRGFDSIYLCTHVKMTENQLLYPKIGYVETERKIDEGHERVYYRKQLTSS